MKRLLLVITIVLVSCAREVSPLVDTAIFLDPEGTLPTRSMDPDANLVSDYNLMIFNSLGFLEEKLFISSREMQNYTGGIKVKLLKGVHYTILAAANLGYALPAMDLEKALAYRFHLAYPDEFTHGIPMSATLQGVEATDEIHLPLRRLMARVDIITDLSMLDPGIDMIFREASVGNCPSSALLFSPSERDGGQGTFASGYFKKMADDRATLYLLESLGEEGGPYIELRAEYFSPTLNTKPGGRLIYRIHFDEALRNAQYTIHVIPHGDGLSNDDPWLVDRRDLEDGG